METQHLQTNQTHNHVMFSQMIEMLIASGLGDKGCRIDQSKNRYAKIRYEDIAERMNQQGHTTSTGRPITGTTLKVLVHRIRKKEIGSLWWEKQKPVQDTN